MLKDSPSFSSFSSNDLAAAKQFYSETLGLEVTEGESDLTLRLTGGSKVFIYPKENHQPATFTVLNFKVKDIDQAVDDLVARGVTFERYDDLPAAQDARGVLRGKAAKQGPDIAWFKDPTGNILSILEE